MLCGKGHKKSQRWGDNQPQYNACGNFPLHAGRSVEIRLRANDDQHQGGGHLRQAVQRGIEKGQGTGQGKQQRALFIPGEELPRGQTDHTAEQANNQRVGNNAPADVPQADPPPAAGTGGQAQDGSNIEVDNARSLNAGGQQLSLGAAQGGGQRGPNDREIAAEPALNDDTLAVAPPGDRPGHRDIEQRQQNDAAQGKQHQLQGDVRQVLQGINVAEHHYGQTAAKDKAVHLLQRVLAKHSGAF